MTTANLSPGSCGGDSIQFEPRPPRTWDEVREMALCDGCGRHFLRHLAVLGIVHRNCADCEARFAAQREAAL